MVGILCFQTSYRQWIVEPFRGPQHLRSSSITGPDPTTLVGADLPAMRYTICQVSDDVVLNSELATSVVAFSNNKKMAGREE